MHRFAANDNGVRSSSGSGRSGDHGPDVLQAAGRCTQGVATRLQATMDMSGHASAWTRTREVWVISKGTVDFWRGILGRSS
jgi:hypothetical protein